MSPRAASPSFRHTIVAILSLGAVHQTAAWPGVQAVFHAFLVVGLAPDFRSPLVAAVWAAVAGWVLEGSLRMYPHMGGTALANMIVSLLAMWTLTQWPPRDLKPYWVRMVAFALLHLLLVHTLVRFAAGSHVWGSGPIWTLVLVPLWGTVAFRLHVPHYRD